MEAGKRARAFICRGIMSSFSSVRVLNRSWIKRKRTSIHCRWWSWYRHLCGGLAGFARPCALDSNKSSIWQQRRKINTRGCADCESSAPVSQEVAGCKKWAAVKNNNVSLYWCAQRGDHRPRTAAEPRTDDDSGTWIKVWTDGWAGDEAGVVMWLLCPLSAQRRRGGTRSVRASVLVSPRIHGPPHALTHATWPLRSEVLQCPFCYAWVDFRMSDPLTLDREFITTGVCVYTASKVQNKVWPIIHYSYA